MNWIDRAGRMRRVFKRNAAEKPHESAGSKGGSERDRCMLGRVNAEARSRCGRRYDRRNIR